MTPLSVWLSLLLIFLGGFAFASLVAGADYWWWGSKSIFEQFIGVVIMMLLPPCFSGIIFLGTAVDSDEALGFLFICLVFNAAQAFIERGLASAIPSPSWTRRFVRAFLSSVCSAVVGLSVILIMSVFVVGLAVIDMQSFDFSFLSKYFGAYQWLVGYGVGFFFAPLSISFFLWMIPTLRLRPGKDRPLEESDAA